MDVFLKRLIWIEFDLDRGLSCPSNYISRWEGDIPNTSKFKIDNYRFVETSAIA
jgi:hypothetical protein